MTKLYETSIDFLVSNLTTKIEKLDLFYQFPLRDEHIKTLVTRCNKITELNVGGCHFITKQSLNFIIEHLQETLVKLNLVDVRFNSSDILKLKGMKKLRLLCYYWHSDCTELKKQLPNLQISSNHDTRIAIPAHPEYILKKEFWEIKVEEEELFVNAYPRAFPHFLNQKL